MCIWKIRSSSDWPAEWESRQQSAKSQQGLLLLCFEDCVYVFDQPTTFKNHRVCQSQHSASSISIDEPVKNSIIYSYDRPVPNSSFLGSISKEVECFIQLASHCSNHHPARRLKWRFQRVLQNVSPESKNLDCRVGIQLCLVPQKYIIKSEVAEPHVLPRSRCLRPELIAEHQTAPILSANEFLVRQSC